MTALALDTPPTMAELNPAFLALLRQLHRAGVASYWWTASEAKDAKNQPKYKHSHWWLVDAPAVLPSDQHPRFGPLHLYFGVFPTGATKTPHRRAEIPDVVTLTALYAEFDCKDFPSPDACHEHVLSLDPVPSACLFSGGGYQTFWLLDEPLLLEDDATRKHAQDLLEAWVVLVGGDQQAKDLSRVLRVPGTINYKAKYGPDYPTAELVWCEPELTYPLAELEALAAPFLAEKPRPQREARESDRTYSLSDDIAQAIKNLDRLSRSRADDYNDWLAVGMALTPLAATGLQLWDDWSSKSEKYVQGECDTKWKTFNLDPHGLAKLGAWANADDPQVRLPTLRPSKQSASRGNPAATEGDPASAGDPAVESAPVHVMPKGFDYDAGGSLVYEQGRTTSLVYPGRLEVTAIGVDVASGQQTYRIEWSGGQSGEAVVPKRALASVPALAEALGSYSIALDPLTTKYVGSFLARFADANAAVLPQELVADRFGYVQSDQFGELLVLPTGAIGTATPVRYIGTSAGRLGADPTAWRKALANVLAWSDAPVAHLIIALALAGPAVARLRPARNPGAYLAGQSGTGKTTLARFAAAAWGDPDRAPLSVQGVGITRVGLLQALARQLGLCVFIDEAHAADEERLESGSYLFANGEARTTGSVDGKGRGGEELRGSLILAGEARPTFRNAGSQRRLLWIDGDRYPPLGAGTIGKPGTPEHALGEQRSQLLAQAVMDGAGHFGLGFAQALWNDWPLFVRSVQQTEKQSSLAGLGHWRQCLAIAFHSLVLASAVVGAIPPPPTLLDDWVLILSGGAIQAEPAEDAAFERVLALIRASIVDDKRSDTRWQVRVIGQEPVAYRRLVHGIALGEWRVPTNSAPYVERCATDHQRFGTIWATRGWITPDASGKSTQWVRLPDGGTRVLVVPDAALDKARGEETDEERIDV
jgi:hypothetical protein